MNSPTGRSSTACQLVLVGAVAIALAAPASAMAAKIVFGSKLKASAGTAFAEPVDSTYWSTKLSGGAKSHVPGTGQILSVRVKGCAAPGTGGAAPVTTVLFQDLRPTGGGAVQVQVTSSPFNLPVCGSAGAGASTVTSFQPKDMCARKGDFVGFDDIGGAGTGFPAGVDYNVFGSSSGASTSSFTKAGATGNGATLTPTKHAGAELLMQMTLGTAKDATALCPGGTGK